MKRLTTMLAAMALLFVGVGQAKAAYVSGVTASTNMGSGFGTNIANTVNGVGLSSLSLTATHAATMPANSWVSGAAILSGSITFDLHGLYVVDSFSFWNQNGGGPGTAGITGIRNVQVLYSTDATTFTALPGGPSVFFQVAGALNLAPETFTFTPVTASAFRFNVQNNYGDPAQTGFAEIAFNGTAVTGTAVPAPSSLALVGMAMATFGGYFGWRRRKQHAVA